MFWNNPFITFHICTLPKYRDKNIAYEKLMFTDYTYLEWVSVKLPNFRDKKIIDLLLELGEYSPVKGGCRSCKTELAQRICFYQAAFLTSRGHSVNCNFEARCSACTDNYLKRGYKHNALPVRFSSIAFFDTVHDRKFFVKELNYALGAPAKLSNESAAKFFYDLYEYNVKNY